MKVFRRVLIKFLILLVVIAVSGGAAACYQAYRQSTPEYAVDHYLSLLIDNSPDKAYTCLDQSEDSAMTKQEYTNALEAKKYSLYASFTAQEAQSRRDNNGNEYIDYNVSFKNAAEEVQAEETFTVKKQSSAVYGIFDAWKILPTHCMVNGFVLTVPAGAEVYLDAEKADASWIVRDGVQLSYDSYHIPSLIPGKIGLTIRHPALESVNTTLDVLGGNADYTGKMALKDSAKSECTELGVKLLRTVYASAVKQKTEDQDELLTECKKEADALIKQQGKEFHTDDATFRNTAISGFAAQFGDLTFADDEKGSLVTEMSFSYHYVVRQDIMVDTEELQEDGTPVQTTQTEELSGDATAKLTMAYYDGAWHITAMDMKVIPE